MSRARARGSSVTLLRERALLLRGQPARRQHALVWGLRGIVALEDPAADAPLGHELADREEVVLQTQQPIQALQDAPGRARAVAIGADEAAHEEAIALLDPSLIVLAVRPGAGEADAPVAAPAQQAGIDELAAIVA